jgi:hypothetical protein
MEMRNYTMFFLLALSVSAHAGPSGMENASSNAPANTYHFWSDISECMAQKQAGRIAYEPYAKNRKVPGGGKVGAPIGTSNDLKCVFERITVNPATAERGERFVHKRERDICRVVPSFAGELPKHRFVDCQCLNPIYMTEEEALAKVAGSVADFEAATANKSASEGIDPDASAPIDPLSPAALTVPNASVMVPAGSTINVYVTQNNNQQVPPASAPSGRWKEFDATEHPLVHMSDSDHGPKIQTHGQCAPDHRGDRKRVVDENGKSFDTLVCYLPEGSSDKASDFCGCYKDEPYLPNGKRFWGVYFPELAKGAQCYHWSSAFMSHVGSANRPR